MRDRRHTTEERERGSSLIEVLIALFILMILMIGILQMFSVAYMVNLGAAARTELTYKCEQVTENIRFISAIIKGGGAAPANSGFPNPIAAGTYNLPYLGTEPEYAYWGPAGANVVSGTGEPYRLSYTIVAEGATFWRITATAVPNKNSAQGRLYGGAGISGKRVDYVSRIPQ